MPFEPKPLLNFERGLYYAKEPWISPENAWTTLQNARMNNGRILKRKGFSQFGYLGTQVLLETVGNGGATDHDTLLNGPLKPPAYISNTSDTKCIAITNGGANTASGWADTYYETVGDGLALLFETLTISLGAGTENYTGTLIGANNPRTPITFDETGGTTQEIIIDYISGPQYGPDAPVQGTSSADADSSGTNTWTPATAWNTGGSYDVTFAVTTVTDVELTYDRCIGWVEYGSTGAPGDIHFTFSPNWPAADVKVDYEYMSEEPVMGIFAWNSLDGNEYLVAADTDYVWWYNVATDNFESPEGKWVSDGPHVSTAFTGSDSDFFHFCAFENILIINNGVDPPQSYDPNTQLCTMLGTGYSGSGNDIDAARFCFRHKNRIVYLRTTEDSSVDYAQRARWTPVNNIEFSGATGDEASYFTDAPTTDKIIAADIIGGEIVVIFDKSVWRLRYTGVDQYSAYVWEQLPAVEGTASPRGNVPLGDVMLYRGHEGINVTDANGVQAADLEIPDEVLSWNLDAEKYSFGVYVPAEHEALLSYADADDSYAERLLVAHLDRNRQFKGWSKYDLSFHCFGRYRRGAVISWDDAVAGMTVDEIMWTLDSLGKSVQFPIILAGDREGNIYEYADGYTDDGNDVTALMRTIRLNPYPGRKCHLGWVDVTVDQITNGTLTVKTYPNYSASAGTNTTVDLTAVGESGKVHRRVRINKIAHLHTVEVSVASSSPFAMDSITIWCKAAGRMREIA
jgi:hypothetical protein